MHQLINKFANSEIILKLWSCTSPNEKAAADRRQADRAAVRSILLEDITVSIEGAWATAHWQWIYGLPWRALNGQTLLQRCCCRRRIPDPSTAFSGKKKYGQNYRQICSFNCNESPQKLFQFDELSYFEIFFVYIIFRFGVDRKW